MRAIIIEGVKFIECDPGIDIHTVIHYAGDSQAFPRDGRFLCEQDHMIEQEIVRLRKFCFPNGEGLNIGFTRKASEEAMDFFAIYERALKASEDIRVCAEQSRAKAWDIVDRFKDSSLLNRLWIAVTNKMN